MVSVNYLTCLVAVWSVVFSGSIWLRSVALAIPLLLLAAVDAVEPLVFLSAQFSCVVLIASFVQARRDLAWSDAGDSSRGGGFSIKSLFVATIYAAILAAMSRSLLNGSPELLRTVLFSGFLVGIAGGLGIHFGLGRQHRLLRIAISCTGLLLVVWAASTMNGFLDEPARMVAGAEWDIAPSDVSLYRWLSVVLATWIVIAITVRIGTVWHAGWSKVALAATVIFGFVSLLPASVVAIGLLGSQPSSLWYGSCDFSSHDDFCKELRDDYPVWIEDLDWWFVSVNSFDKIHADIDRARKLGNATGVGSSWSGKAQHGFENIRLISIGRRLFVDNHAKAELPEDYRTIRDKELAKCAPLGWRARFYEILLWVSGRRYAPEALEFERHNRTLVDLLATDLEIRKRRPSPFVEFDWEPAIKDVIDTSRDSYRGEPGPYGYIIEDGDFTLYSVGYDGIDDNGTPMNTLFGKGDIALPTREVTLELMRAKQK